MKKDLAFFTRMVNYRFMKLIDYLESKKEPYPTFAKKIGVSLQSLYRYTKGDRIPERDVMAKITKVTKGEVNANSFYQ